MGTAIKRKGGFETQNAHAEVQENKSGEIEGVCGRAPGCVPERNRWGIWLHAICRSKSMEAIEDYEEKKTTTYEEQDHDKAAEYKYETADIPPENIAYVNETGIDCYFYREYGYGPRGQLIYGRIKGRKYMCSSIVAAQMGGEIIAPCQYTGTMSHKLFEEWFQDHLFPALPKGTVIVMDNASFHRKEQLYCLAQKSECYLIFLPPYSPELNPIEHFWAWLKRSLRKILPKLDSLDEAFFAAFHFRRQLSSA